mmetsp:Transcript_31542/g.100836  ORF Transcript_31542/g.100836 Transcript_31542/m.100836 type:complete len:269 (-) Transcript_31542:1369-2175(-)
MLLKRRSSFSPRGAWKRSPLVCSSSVPAAFLPPTFGRTCTSRSRCTLPVRMSWIASCVTRSASSATCFSRATTRLRSSLISRKVAFRLVATLALSVTSRMKCASAPASGGICCAAPVMAGATKLIRKKVHAPSSCFETDLTVETWKGTRRPNTGSSTVSLRWSTYVWLVRTVAPDADAFGNWLRSRYATGVSCCAAEVPPLAPPLRSRSRASSRIRASSSPWWPESASFVSTCFFELSLPRVRLSRISTLPRPRDFGFAASSSSSSLR